MNSRRTFLKTAALAAAGMGIAPTFSATGFAGRRKGNKPVIISTWNHGLGANVAGWDILAKGGSALDAVEAAVRIPEADPAERSVGYGGFPDRDGHVTLDASIMDHMGNCGAVACLEHIMHPISVARKVMEKTPHVMLVGQGALDFALSQGFEKQNLLTPESEADWRKWLEKAEYKPMVNFENTMNLPTKKINSENHDTIGTLAIDANGHLAGACTTSGAAWKMHGRVGDSPIIGGGLFVDGEAGCAVATGLGEAVIRTAGATIVVELMRQGKSPYQAAKEVVERIYRVHHKLGKLDDLQVGILAMNSRGEYGGYSLRAGFNFALCAQGVANQMVNAEYKMEW